MVPEALGGLKTWTVYILYTSNVSVMQPHELARIKICSTNHNGPEFNQRALPAGDLVSRMHRRGHNLWEHDVEQGSPAFNIIPTGL